VQLVFGAVLTVEPLRDALRMIAVIEYLALHSIAIHEKAFLAINVY
jgi:hypothetical protein